MAGIGTVFDRAEGIQHMAVEGVEGTCQTLGTVIIAMVIAGQQHIKAGVLRTLRNLIGAVEIGKTGVFLAVDTGKGGFQIGYRIVGGGNIGLYKGEDVIKIVSAIHFAGAYNGKMQHQVTCNRDVCPGNLHQLAGVNVDRLGLGINILHGHDGRFLTGKLYQMVTVGEQTKAEGDGCAADEKEHQKTQREGEKPDSDIHAPGDFKFVLFCIFHSCAPQVSSR